MSDQRRRSGSALVSTVVALLVILGAGLAGASQSGLGEIVARYPNVRHVIDLGKYAFDQGSEAVLVPMPMFFRYQQQDLAEYCREVAQALAAPCLIYDLPDFTNPI